MAPQPSMRLAGEDLWDRHVCVLVDAGLDFYAALGVFIADGLRVGDREIHLVAARQPHLERLREMGIEVDAAVASAQLEVIEWSEWYGRVEPFSPAQMVEFVREQLDAGRRLGFARTRWIAAMEWAEGTAQPELVAYEAQLNGLLRARPDVIVCAYDLARHGTSLITAVLDAHPLTLHDGKIRANRPVSRPAPRERILMAADDYFHTLGIRATGVDTLIAAAGVAKATFYRHFPSKDDLVVAWLSDDRPRWFYRVRATVRAAGGSPAARLGRLFDETAAWLESSGFRGCAFQNAAIEITDSSHPAWPVIRGYLDEVEAFLRDDIASGIEQAPELARQLAVLLSGALALGVAQRSTAPVRAARDAALRLLASF